MVRDRDKSPLQGLILTLATSAVAFLAEPLLRAPALCAEATGDPSILLTVEFHGPEAARNWYRAGLASSNNVPNLKKWWLSQGMLTNFCAVSHLPTKDATNLREALEQPEMRRLRSSVIKRDATQHYMITVRSADTNYYIQLGLDRDALTVIRKLKSSLSQEAAQPIRRIDEQLAFFLAETNSTEK